MKQSILSPKSKITVDIILIVLLPLAFISGEIELISEAYWRSFHCIIGSIFTLLIILHIIQHWKLIKALPKKKVFAKNKTTAFLTLIFILIIISILTYIPLFSSTIIWEHQLVGKLLCIIAIVHTIQKWKRLKILFRNRKAK